MALTWKPQDLTDDKSTLVQVMAWCRQATSHYLSQCWPRSLSPYDVTRPQWVNQASMMAYIDFYLCYAEFNHYPNPQWFLSNYAQLHYTETCLSGGKCFHLLLNKGFLNSDSPPIHQNYLKRTVTKVWKWTGLLIHCGLMTPHGDINRGQLRPMSAPHVDSHPLSSLTCQKAMRLPNGEDWWTANQGLRSVPCRE